MTPYLVHCSICTLIRLSSDHLLNFCHVPDTLSTSNTNRVAAEPQASSAHSEVDWFPGKVQ